MTFSIEQEMYPILMEYFSSRGYRTKKQASFKMMKGWVIDVAAYDEKKKESIGVEAKLSLEDALEGILQAEMYQMACSKVYVAFPHTEWDSKTNREMRRNVEEICKKRGIGILKVVGKGLTRPCEEIVKPALGLRIDLVQGIQQDIKRSFKSFVGFDEDDFSYFLDHQDWKKEMVKKKLDKLGQEIKKLIPRKSRFLRDHDIRMQVIGKNYAGLNIFKGTKHTKCSHFSIGIGASFFSVFIQIPTKRLVKRHFLVKLKKDKEEFLSLTNNLPDFNIEIYSRTSQTEHGRPIPGGTIYNKQLDMKISKLTPELLNQLIKLIEEIPYPAINFRRDYDVESSEYMVNKKEILNFVFNVVNTLEPIYDFIPR